MRPLDIIELVLLGGIWGASFLFQRVASPVFGPYPLVLLRAGIAAVMLVAIAVARNQLGDMRTHWRPIALVGAINTAIPFSLFAYATLSVSAGMAAVLNGTAPLFGAVVGILWFGERPNGRRTAGLLAGFAGVVLLVWDDFSRPGTILGMLAGLLASVCYGVAVHISRRRLATVSPFAVAGGSQVAAAMLLAIPAWWAWPAVAPGRAAWLSAIALGVFCTGLAYALYFRLIARIGATRSMTVAYLIPLFGMIWGELFLDEAITPAMIAGCATILTGVALITRTPAPTTAPATSP